MLKSATRPLAPSNVLKCARQVALIHKKVFTLHNTQNTIQYKKVSNSLHARADHIRFAKVGAPRGRGQIWYLDS